MLRRARAYLQGVLARADVTIDGGRPSDPTLHDERVFLQVLLGGSLAVGESYVDGWWDCAALDEMIFRVVSAGQHERLRGWPLLIDLCLATLTNRGARHRAFDVGRQHYDIGNDLYEAMLDRRLVYSCGYWNGAQTLDQAQEAKLDLICRKLGLRAGMRVLDIGCGFGGFAAFAAERYGVHVVGIAVSEQQLALGRERCARLPVELHLRDYREVRGTFDAIASMGMFEHVGAKNYHTFFEVARRCLAPDGRFLLHTIGSNATNRAGDPWITRYIFPNSLIPSMRQLAAALEGRFVIEDVQNLGAHYERTLRHWFRNFDGHWDRLRAKYGERFYRMWRFYLLSCAGMFRARYLQVWQLVLSRSGIPGGYEAVR